MADRLAARLAKEGGSAADWAMLGRSAAALGRRDQAAGAFTRASALAGSADADVLVEHAAFLLEGRDALSAAQAETLLARALQAAPQHLQGLLLAGELAFSRGDVNQALQAWRRAQAAAPAGSEVARLLARSLQAAHGQAAASAGVRLGGTVRLDAALAGTAKPDDVVFVFARPADQPQGMPVAISRHQLRELPLKVLLDLGEQPVGSRWVMSARVAKGGDALPQPGDLHGMAVAAIAGAQDVQVHISQIQR